MTTIRPATIADLPAILDIYNEIIVHTTAVYDYEPHSLEMRRSWFDAKMRDGFPVFAATDESGGVVGFAALGPFRAWAAYQFTVENSLYVAAGKRGRGIGRLLLQQLIHAASGQHMHTILAGIDSSNDASIRLHESFHFQKVAEFKEVGYKFNRWLNLSFLQLILPV